MSRLIYPGVLFFAEHENTCSNVADRQLFAISGEVYAPRRCHVSYVNPPPSPRGFYCVNYAIFFCACQDTHSLQITGFVKPSARRRHRGQGFHPCKPWEDIFPRCLPVLSPLHQFFFSSLFGGGCARKPSPGILVSRILYGRCQIPPFCCHFTGHRQQKRRLLLS